MFQVSLPKTVKTSFPKAQCQVSLDEICLLSRVLFFLVFIGCYQW